MKRIRQTGSNRKKWFGGAVTALTGTALVCILGLETVGVLGQLTKPLMVSAVSSSSITSESIREKQGQITQAENERKTLESGLSNLKQIKKELEATRSDLKNYVAQLDGNLAEIEAKIEELNVQIASKEADIAQTQKELEEATAKEENQKESMTQRIRLMYEMGQPKIFELLVTSKNFGEFLNRADFVEQIMLYDHQRWIEYQLNRQYIELCKEQLDLEKEILDATRENVEIEQHNLEELIDQKSRDIIAYETDISNKEKAIKEYEADIQEQNEIIEALEAAIAEEKRRIIAENGKVLIYDNGVFKFPLASYTRISDEYGMRMHPTLGVEQFHNGVDFAAPKGTAIYAAYDGVVVAASYSGSMGNYVMIDHGSGLYTIYMHASALYVKKDDIVVRGETIAAVGSTGRSTGNHLHFGVRRDGAYVSPWEYLSE